MKASVLPLSGPSLTCALIGMLSSKILKSCAAMLGSATMRTPPNSPLIANHSKVQMAKFIGTWSMAFRIVHAFEKKGISIRALRKAWKEAYATLPMPYPRSRVMTGKISKLALNTDGDGEVTLNKVQTAVPSVQTTQT